MLPSLEVRVREAQKQVGKLATGEVIGEEFHRVGAESGDVLVGAWQPKLWWGRILGAEGGDAVCDVVEDLGP